VPFIRTTLPTIAFFIREKRVSRVDADDQHVAPLLVVGFGDKTSFAQSQIGNFIVVRRNAVGLRPAVIFAFVSDVVVKARRAEISDARRDQRDVFDCARLR
jgi:hypothetical protein